jgi:hypothetical protein
VNADEWKEKNGKKSPQLTNKHHEEVSKKVNKQYIEFP